MRRFLTLVIGVLLAAGCAHSEKNVALVESASSGDLQGVQKLLKEGADVEATALDGLSPLEAAAKGGHLDVVRYLVATAGASVNGKGSSTRTALGLALIYEHRDCAEYLASRGGELRGTEQWKNGLIKALQQDHQTELYNLVTQLQRQPAGR